MAGRSPRNIRKIDQALNPDSEVGAANFGICRVERGRVSIQRRTVLFFAGWRGLTPKRRFESIRGAGFGPKGKFRKSEFGLTEREKIRARWPRFAGILVAPSELSPVVGISPWGSVRQGRTPPQASTEVAPSALKNTCHHRNQRAAKIYPGSKFKSALTKRHSVLSLNCSSDPNATIPPGLFIYPKLNSFVITFSGDGPVSILNVTSAVSVSSVKKSLPV